MMIQILIEHVSERYCKGSNSALLSCIGVYHVIVITLCITHTCDAWVVGLEDGAG